MIPIVFHAVQNHHAEQCASEVSQLEEIIHYLSATFSYRADNYNFKKKPISADNDMVVDIQYSASLSNSYLHYFGQKVCTTLAMVK